MSIVGMGIDASKRVDRVRPLCGVVLSLGMRAVLLVFLTAPHSQAVDLTAELTAGYDSNPALIDEIWSAGIQISRFWGGFEFFGEAEWRSGDAPLDYESYTQRVIQCGLSYSF